mmetsp:Transcript_4037/g.11716  ORF Transcript_4037/g.11716 Transcript_4037/m.11716 type:complete len:160 (+) Transcript_4037:92-571(+)
MLKMYNLYIFDRRGSCMYFHEWQHEAAGQAPREELDPKLVFGLLFSLKQLAIKLAPGSAGADPLALARDGAGNVTSFSTSTYTLHQFETASGLRFVLNTARCKEQVLVDVQAALRYVYSDLFVKLMVKNPLYTPGSPISNPNFTKQLDKYLVGVANRFP